MLLLTATPIQNNLTELWGLIQYVEPPEHCLETSGHFAMFFVTATTNSGSGARMMKLRRRIETVVQRTLRRQAQDFLDRPFVGRRRRYSNSDDS